MIPILFDSKATSFTTNGIGRLSDCISCVVREERNGPFECEFTYPVTGKHYEDIKLSNIVVVKPSPNQSLQAFRIYRVSRPIGGVVTVYLRHISYQLSFIPFKAFSASSLAGALAGFKTNALEPCPFTLTADFTSSSSYAVPLPASIRSYLGGREGSIIDVYGNGASGSGTTTTAFFMLTEELTEVLSFVTARTSQTSGRSRTSRTPSQVSCHIGPVRT